MSPVGSLRINVTEEWRDRAACRGSDPELFFPPSGRSEESAAAKRVCRPCPVKQECGEWALRTRQQYGILGGMSVRQRDAVLRCRAGRCDHPNHQHDQVGAA